MVQFNPQIAPTGDPKYEGVSRGTTQIATDTTAEVGLKGAADVLNYGVQGAGKILNTKIEEDIFKAVDATREEHTQRLNLLKESAEPNVPQGVRNLTAQAGNLHEAYSGGKVSNTYYYARLAAIAKQFRTQYPGHREFIDKEISSITGVNPANAYMNSLVSELNKTKEEKDSAEKDARSMLKKMIEEGHPDAWKMYKALDEGGNPIVTLAWANQQYKQKYERNEAENRRKAEAGDREDTARTADRDTHVL